MKTLILAALLTLSSAVNAECETESVNTDFSQYDLDGDGLVGFSDFGIFRSVFGTSGEIGDFNGDNVVDLSDFSLFRNAFGVSDEVVITVRCYQ